MYLQFGQLINGLEDHEADNDRIFKINKSQEYI